MAAATVPSPYRGLIQELMQTCNAWQSARIISEDKVDLLNVLVLLCGFAPSYAGSADFPCLHYEIQEAAKAFLSKDFLACQKHVTEANAWKKAIDQEAAEARTKRRKTPVR